MGIGVLFAATIPGLVVLLVLLAAVEHLASRLKRRSAITGRHRPVLAAAGLDVFSGTLLAGKDAELEHRDLAKRLKVESGDAAPGSVVDLSSGTAHIRLPRS